MFRGMDSEDSEAREDSASEDSHPSTDASEDSVEVRVGGVLRPPPPNCAQNYSPGRSYSPQGSLSPTRALSPPLIGLPHACPSVSRLPPKLRKCYNSLASNSLSQVLNANSANSTLAYAAPYDHLQSSGSKRLSGYGAPHEDTQSNSRRRKPAEPRRLYADQSKKRVHSPSPEYRESKSPKLSYEGNDRPLKLQRLATPNPSPPARTSPSSPPSSSLGAPPLIHHSLLSSPLVRAPTISPTLTPGIARNLIPPRWPTMSYQHYTRLLGSVLPNPLALLPGGLPIPPYPIVPLLHHLPVTPPVQSPSPQPPHNTCSPLPSPVIRLPIPDSNRNQISDAMQNRNREPLHQEEPVSLVKRESSKSLFSVASLVESPPKLKKSSSKPLPAPMPTTKSTPPSSATSISRAPASGLPRQSTTSLNLKLKSETTPSCSSLDASHAPLTPASRLPVVSASTCSPVAGERLSSAQQQQQQQQLLRQKQRNYKNMTRERRIEANARERTRVHTISSAYEKLRQSVPSYSHNQKLSKLSILRIASSYILTLSKLAGNSSEHEVADCVEETTKTIQFEGRAKKKRED